MIRNIFFLIVVLFVSLYFMLVVKDQYVVGFQLQVNSKQMVAPDVLSGILGANKSASDLYILREYIKSNVFVNELMTERDLKKIYGCDIADRFFCLKSDASLEVVTSYWRDKLDVQLNKEAGLLIFSLSTYRPSDSYDIAQSVISLSSEWVNSLNEDVQADSLSLAKAELDQAEVEFIESQDKLVEFQDVNAQVNLESTVSSRMNTVSNLELELSKVESNLAEIRSYMRDDSPKVKLLANKRNALKQQINKQNNRVLNAEGDGEKKTSSLLKEVERLKLEKTLSETRYAKALSVYSSAVAEVNAKQKYLIKVVKPVRPTESTEPKRLYSIFKSLLVVLASFLMINLIMDAVKEHVGWG